MDDRVGGRVVQGRDSYLEAYGLLAADRGAGVSDPAEPLALLVSADQILDQFSYPTHVRWAPGVDHWVLVGTVGPRGYTHVLTAASLEHWRARGPTSRRLDRFEALADRYVAWWNGDEGVDATQVYRSGASIEDTLTGLSVQGVGNLRGVERSGAWPDLPQLEISALPDDPGGDPMSSRQAHVRAVYLGPAVPGSAEPDVMIVILRAEGGSGCPGVVGAAMAVVRGRIAWERRYHEVEQVRRCLDADSLEPGWWEGIDIPEPVVHELTGTVTLSEPSRGVELYNGTPETEEYVRWGLQRFAAAGVTLPKVDSVTFVLDQSRCPLRSPGFAWYSRSGADIWLCFQPGDVCVDPGCSNWTTIASRTLLHEYAHAWIAQNVTESTREAFMGLAGVSRWQDFDDEWDQRGVERAANTIMLGLLDKPLPMEPRACEVLAVKFRLLTGAAPPAPCSA